MVNREFVGMKRVNEIVDRGNENLGSKRVKFFNGIDESCVALDRNEGEEKRVFVENGAKDSSQVHKNGDLFGDIVPDNLYDPILDGLEGSNKWDFDINFDLIFGNEEEQKGLVFDLNLPVYGTQDVGMEKGCLEYTQGPMINENKVEIIDIASDDSENEVEIIGYTCGYNAKDKQIELGMPRDRMENLCLGLGVGRTDNAVGQSSLETDGERRYTREEKGKASVIDPWLSLEANSSIVLDLQTDSDESIRSNEPTEDVEDRTWQPAAPAPRPELAERALRQAEQALRNRERLTREAWRDTAKRFARITYSDQNNGNQSSSQKQQQPTSRPVEQLGNTTGPFSDALKMVRERTSKRAAQQLIEWRPSEENHGRGITAAFVPSLLDLSLKALAESAEGIVSLEQVPDNLRGRLTNMLCDIGKMNAHIMNLLAEGCPTEIRIKNCSWLTEKQFQQTFRNCQTKDLRVIGFCSLLFISIMSCYANEASIE